MNNKVLGLLVACAILLASVPAVSSTSGPNTPINPVVPCGPMNWAGPATFMPLFVTAMQDTNMLMIQLQEVLAGMEDTSAYDQQIAVINEQIALAAQGSNFVHKKDLVLVAKSLLEQFLGTA